MSKSRRSACTDPGDAKRIRATAFKLDQFLFLLRSDFGELDEEARELGSDAALELAEKARELVCVLDTVAGSISAAGRAFEGHVLYPDFDEDDSPSATDLVLDPDLDVPRPDVRAIAVLIRSVECGDGFGDWQNRLAAEAVAWLVRQQPELTQELRELAASGNSHGLAFLAQVRP